MLNILRKIIRYSRYIKRVLLPLTEVVNPIINLIKFL